MCSLGAVQYGVKATTLPSPSSSLSICEAPMPVNAVSGERMVHRSIGGGSIATALRDHRRSCVIPIQPNRSLPVHPAPHHTHCRANGIIARGANRNLLRAAATFVSSACRVKDSAHPTSRPYTAKRVNGGNAAATMRKRPDRIERIENALMEGLEYLGRDDPVLRPGITQARYRGESVDRQDFIDISRSPDINVLAEANRQEAHSTGQQLASVKRKRKRPRGTADETRSDVSDRVEASKTVPPLRLKKIRDLEVMGSGAETSERRAAEIRTNDSADPPGTNENPHGPRGNSGEYRVVTGHTPPYDGTAFDAPNTREREQDSLDAAKLRYKRSKLIVKLGQLRSKVFELGNEMLRTVLSSADGPRNKKEQQIRQKLNRYKRQIENLEHVLEEWPEVPSRIEDSATVIDRQARDGSLPIRVGETANSSSRIDCGGSNSSSRRSSPCLEPPKLSPKFPTNYEAARSPSQLRNSPPILPRVYVTLTDCTDDSCDGKTTKSARKVASEGKRSKESQRECKKTESSCVVPIDAFETVRSQCDDDLEDAVGSPRSTNGRVEIPKKDADVSSSGHFLDIVEVYEDTKISIETKDRLENLDTVLPATMKRSASPLDVLAVKMSPKSEGTKRMELRVIEEARMNTDPSDSSYDATAAKPAGEEKTERLVVALGDDDVAENAVNGIPISERFPTLASWIATLSEKRVIDVDTESREVPMVVEQPTVFRGISPETVKRMEVQNPARTSVEENHPNGEQWRNEEWREAPTRQSQQQQQPLLQSYGAVDMPLPHSQPPPALGQDVCSPIAMAGFYARNYLDHYSMAYSYNPTIAAAASLWNGAAILQCPLMRPTSSLLSAHQRSARLSPENLQFSLSDSVSQSGNAPCGVTMRTVGKLHDRPKGAVDHRRSVVDAQQPKVSRSSANSEATDYRNFLQQQQPQQQRHAKEREEGYGRSYGGTRLGVAGSAWRTSHLLAPITTDYGFNGGINAWPGAPPILNSHRRAASSAPSYVPNAIDSSRSTRVSSKKATSPDSNLRDCSTPNLGKVLTGFNNIANYVCSECGMVGPMFKCLGCEVAFYCNENCQARHWKCHVKSCPKKMPKLKKVVP